MHVQDTTLDQVVEIISEYFNINKEDIDQNTNINTEFILDEDDYINIADIMQDEMGTFVSASDIEASDSIEELVEIIKDME